MKLGQEDSREEGWCTFRTSAQHSGRGNCHHRHHRFSSPVFSVVVVVVFFYSVIVSISQVKACAVVRVCWPQEAFFPPDWVVKCSTSKLFRLMQASSRIRFCSHVFSSQLVNKILCRNECV